MRWFRAPFVVVAVVCALAFNATTARAGGDPFADQQYGPDQIGATTAWAKSTASGVKVAVVDSGVDVQHPDLQQNLDLADSYDFSCNDADPNDDSTLTDANGHEVRGHGTHVTGIIGATTGNGIGMEAVAPNVKVMVEKVFATDNSCGTLTSALNAVPKAINYAVAHGARVINLSLGELLGNGIVGTVSTPCNNAFANGAVCVIASGNSGESKASGYDRNINAVLATANDANGNHAAFGQPADTKWGVSAPGVHVLSTWPTSPDGPHGYAFADGTSMAAPHVTGALALLLGAGMTVSQAVDALVATAGPAKSAVEGAGLIHVAAALGVSAEGHTSPTLPAIGPHGASGKAAPATTSPAASGGAAPASPSTTDDFAAGLLSDSGTTTTSTAPSTPKHHGSNSARPLSAVAAVAIGAAVFVLRRRARATRP